MTLLACCALIAAITGVVHSRNKESDAAILGIWRGELDNVPAVTLNITERGGWPFTGSDSFLSDPAR